MCELSERTIESIEEQLVQRIIRGVFRTYESTHRLEIEKHKEILVPEVRAPFLDHSVFLNNLSVARELREVIVVFQEIKLSVSEVVYRVSPGGWTNGGAQPPEIPSSERFISPYGLVNSMYNRIHELRYRAKENYAILSQLGLRNQLDRLLKLADPTQAPPFECSRRQTERIFGPQKKELEPHAILEHLITDSIFCLHELLRCLQTFGLSYMANHSMRAASHEKLASWCDDYYAYLRSLGNDWPGTLSRLKERLGQLIGRADLVNLTPRYHYEKALLHYRAAIQTHTEGRAYKAIIERMCYLDDDFSDELTHFCAAIERFRINTGDIEKKIAELATKCSKTDILDPARYFEGPPPPS